MRLNQVTLEVKDIQVSRAFYINLGFRLLVDSDHYCRFLAPHGDTTFSIHVGDAPSGTGATLYLESDDIDSDFEALRGNGVKFDTEPADQSWLWREAIFRDPDGHCWKLYHAGENRIDPPWRVALDKG